MFSKPSKITRCAQSSKQVVELHAETNSGSSEAADIMCIIQSRLIVFLRGAKRKVI